MKVNRLKTKNYKIFIGKNSLKVLNNELKKVCSRTNKIAIIYDKRVPKKFLSKIKKSLSKHKLFIFFVTSSEKNKNLFVANNIISKLLKNNFNRSDLIIGVGGGIIGDLSGFISSIYKRGLNFINIPTTLLAQVDSCIGGKTGVNSSYGKNLIGSFYNPKAVFIETEFLKTLPRREMVCGYAEIIKHAIIKDKNFFNWLEKNTEKILKCEDHSLIIAIKKSCEIKLSFTEKDFKEKNLRMKLNFGHTFAHALEIKNKYSKKLNHGEAVLIGMYIAVRVSKFKKLCSENTVMRIKRIYDKNQLLKNVKKFIRKNEILKSVKFMKNDKKNNDDKINFILLRNIAKTTEPGNYKFNIGQINQIVNKLF